MKPGLDRAAWGFYAPNVDHDIEYDATGLLCPLPVLKARKRLQAMRVGQVLCLISDDPAALIDVPHFCAEQGHELLGQDETPDGIRFYLRK